jgi:hypothetical protein
MTRVDERTVVERFSWRLHSHWIPTGTLRVDLITGLNELHAWIGDDHWWRNGSHAGWLALVADLRGAIAEAGIPLRQTLGETLNTLDTRLNAFGDALRQDKKLPRSRAAFNPSVYAALDRDERLLRETLAKPACVQAAWAGLWEAGRDGAADGVLDQLEVELWRVADHAGHPWDRLVHLVGGVLADSARFVDEARRDIATGEIGLLQREPERGGAGLSIAGRLDLIDRYLGLPVVDTDSEVWVGVEDAFFEDRMVACGPIEFWNGPLLRATLTGSDPGDLHVPLVVRRHHELFEWCWEDRAERAGFALARVRVGSGRPSGARADAREAVAATLVLAGFDNGYCAWRVADRGLLHFAAGDWVYREQLDPGRAPKGLELARIAQDETPNALRVRAPDVAPCLPLRTSTIAVRHAFELLHWLAEGRATPGPARIVLTKRVIERVAGWAHVNDDTFTDQQLAIPWARKQTIVNIAEVTRVALGALKRDGDPSCLDAWERAHEVPLEIISDDGVLDASRAVEHLDWLIGRFAPGAQARRDLERLKTRVADGITYGEWIDELRAEFKLLRGRYNRHRNAIVHGGPLDEQSISTILLFVDSLAVDVLGSTLECVFAGTPLTVHFAHRKQVYDDWLKQIRSTGQDVHRSLGVPM